MITTKAFSEDKEQVHTPGYDLRKENKVFFDNISRQVIALAEDIDTELVEAKISVDKGEYYLTPEDFMDARLSIKKAHELLCEIIDIVMPTPKKEPILLVGCDLSSNDPKGKIGYA